MTNFEGANHRLSVIFRYSIGTRNTEAWEANQQVSLITRGGCKLCKDTVFHTSQCSLSKIQSQRLDLIRLTVHIPYRLYYRLYLLCKIRDNLLIFLEGY